MNNKIVKRIQNEFNDVTDLIIRNINLGFNKVAYVIYLESICSSTSINDFILKNLTNLQTFNKLINHLAGPNVTEVKVLDQMEFYLNNGFTLVIYKDKVLAIETKGELTRGIGAPNSENSINGPKDAFTENYQTNLGLIKRRIKSKDLKTIDFFIGRKTNTKISILYFEDIAEKKLVDNVKDKLAKIDIDGIVDSSEISNIFESENNTPLPMTQSTERPDNVVNALLEGKIAILVDTSPFVLIIPAFLSDFINPPMDNYNKSININFLRILRICCFFFSITIPGTYISLVNYNQETIPTNLLVSFSIQRNGVPFPAVAEAIMMLIVCEILSESDLRFPNSYGSAISILGALILGEAAVNAGVVSPIMIIVISITFMTSLMFPEKEMNGSIRFYRFIFLFSAAILGLMGMVYAFIYFLINLTSLKSYGEPYFYPIVPFDKVYFNKTVRKSPKAKDTKRSKLLASKNIIKQKENNL